ncbi:uncharacterized protein LOC117223363 [Megalopta genalis]|uniref:uncharacterized protein LOC117223363 n=1 Tax=Megalopta genalis TaxID=115081 RepID=UPI003FD51296
MAFVYLFIAAFGLLNLSVAVPVPDGDQDNEIAIFNDLSSNINKIFDEMLPSVREMIIKEGMDPLKMKDMNENLPGIIHDGVLQLTNGWMSGLGQVKRSGDVILSYDDKKITIDALLGLDVMDLTYDYLFQYSLISREGGFHGRFSNINMRLLFTVDLHTYKAELDTLHVASVGKMDVKLEGHELDHVLNIAIKVFVGIFRKEVIKTIEVQSLDVMKAFIEKINARIPKPDLDARIISHDSEMVDNIPTFIEFRLV